MLSWTLCFITNEKGAESSKILTLFIHAPSSGFLRPLSLMFPYSRRVMIVLRRSLYGVVPDGRVLGLFVPLPPAILTGFPQGASILLEAGFGRIVFVSAVFLVFHSRYQRT